MRDAISSGQWGLYEGPLLRETHRRLQELWGLSESLLCSSGTIAVELALRGCGVKPGDEVILSGYDFPGNFRAIESAGATPVIVDVVAGGWTMDPEQVSAAISDQTRAILVSHLHGETAAIQQIARVVHSASRSREGTGAANKISIVEDLCQSPGAKLGGQMLGTFGDVTTLSFGGSKLLSAGRGGAVLLDSAEIIQRIRVFAHRGNDAFPFSQIQAALLLPQLDQLEALNQRRAGAAERVAAAVNGMKYLSALPAASFEQSQNQAQNQSNEFWNLPALYKMPILIGEEAPFRRADFLSAIQPEGIAIAEGFRGFAKRSKRRCRSIGDLPNSIAAAERTMVLHHPILLSEPEVIDRLVETIARVEAYCDR